ncbi:MAG: hypothetical protein M3Y66_01645, partial [Actinomycetota bacterium]|nr:hypothetical protein [Actinomycetota bacterium]
MAPSRRDTSDKHGSEPKDQGPAPADLLQMWISGRATSEPEAGSETGESTSEPETDAGSAGDAGEQADLEDSEAYAEPGEVDEQAGGGVDNAAEPLAAESPGAEEWWPTDHHEETSAEPADGPSQLWPYDGPAPTEQPPTDQQDEPIDQAGQDTSTEESMPTADLDSVSDESLWHLDVEAEWSEADAVVEDSEPIEEQPVEEQPDTHDVTADQGAAAATVEPTEVTEPGPPDTQAAEPPPQELTDQEIAANTARGWASFGAAPTAEDVLDRIDIQGAWSDRFTGGPPVVVPRLPEAEPTGGQTTDDAPETTDQIGGPETELADGPDTESAEQEPSAESAEPAEPAEPAELDSETTTRTVQPRGLDMSTTAHWTLDDFEAYIQSQSGNELSEWIGGAQTDETRAAGTPGEAVIEVDESPA